MLPLVTLLLLASQDTGASPPVLELSPLFGDHMVLQCGEQAVVWGKAPPGQVVSVTLRRSGSGDTHSTFGHTGQGGLWQAAFSDTQPGGPWSLHVSTEGSPETVLEDVWLGDVWICSGQSNMEWPLSQSSQADAEIAAADRPRLRLFQVPRRASAQLEREAQGAWTPCRPETASSFSAVGYHFGRALAEHLDRPIGLIQAAWGGTPAEAWTRRTFLEGVEAFAPILEREPPNEAHAPAALFNGMIAPLMPLRVRGVIWYQGESNAGRAEQYRELFPTMIRSWRMSCGRDDLPFLFVQLANFKEHKAEPGESDWAELREAQAMALGLPHTGMAVAIDIGAADDIHPRDKRTVGDRLALEARRVAYGEAVASRGPTFRSMRVDGGRVMVEFDHAEGLGTTDGGPPVGFAMAGDDRVFHWAEASLQGDAVVLSCPAVPEPVAIRFAWADNPAHNLVNGAALPAVPFRTDSWPGVTAGRR